MREWTEEGKGAVEGGGQGGKEGGREKTTYPDESEREGVREGAPHSAPNIWQAKSVLMGWIIRIEPILDSVGLV